MVAVILVRCERAQEVGQPGDQLAREGQPTPYACVDCHSLYNKNIPSNQGILYQLVWVRATSWTPSISYRFASPLIQWPTSWQRRISREWLLRVLGILLVLEQTSILGNTGDSQLLNLPVYVYLILKTSIQWITQINVITILIIDIDIIDNLFYFRSYLTDRFLLFQVR